MATLKIDIIAVGKLKERFWAEACAEYLKRLTPYAEIQIKEVDDISPVRVGSSERSLELEAAGIRASLAASTSIIVLDRQGVEQTSEQIAELLQTYLENRAHHVSFIIGGSDGLSSGLIRQADKTVSFGSITLPHNLARVVLLEQLYRAFKIIRNEPYHK
ncbi:MAG: 23S rRNA (pseudouridine(1915)-N(3))-methyltransferase RlmH [Coriobacteriia bacterium]|nr:23S rRNA (pseudouridine(1915)-N(3))-methyltransferase RlmH [Coriobacteriia bacterium]